MSFPLVIQTGNHAKKFCIAQAWNRQCVAAIFSQQKEEKGGKTQN
jgi:hypothetical protein